jgi:formylmethanofuran dehydrogenase subunit E
MIRLEVKSLDYEEEVVINGIVCDYCGDHEFESEAHYVGEAQICDSCYEGCIA